MKWFLQKKNQSKLGTLGRQEWRWGSGAEGKESFLVVEGKKNHISISLLKRSLRRNGKLKRAKSLRKGLCFPERAVNSRAQTVRADEASIPGALRTPWGSSGKLPPHRAEGRI